MKMSSFRKVQAKKWLQEKGLLPSQIEERSRRARILSAQVAATSTKQYSGMGKKARSQTAIAMASRKAREVEQHSCKVYDSKGSSEAAPDNCARRKVLSNGLDNKKQLLPVYQKTICITKNKYTLATRECCNENPMLKKGEFADFIPLIDSPVRKTHEDAKEKSKSLMRRNTSTPSTFIAPFHVRKEFSCMDFQTRVVSAKPMTSSAPLRLLRAPRIPKTLIMKSPISQLDEAMS